MGCGSQSGRLWLQPTSKNAFTSSTYVWKGKRSQIHHVQRTMTPREGGKARSMHGDVLWKKHRNSRCKSSEEFQYRMRWLRLYLDGSRAPSENWIWLEVGFGMVSDEMPSANSPFAIRNSRAFCPDIGQSDSMFVSMETFHGAWDWPRALRDGFQWRWASEVGLWMLTSCLWCGVITAVHFFWILWWPSPMETLFHKRPGRTIRCFRKKKNALLFGCLRGVCVGHVRLHSVDRCD